MDDKRCARCGEVKPRAEFYANRQWRDGLHPYCKPCLLTYQRDRRFAKLDAADPNRRRWSRRFVRHNYLDEIDRPVKAYLLGLLAADGNVLVKPPRVTLELNAKDEELTRLFRDEVAPTVRIRHRPPRENAAEQSVIAVTSPGLVSGLAQWGIVPRKTWSYAWPTNLPNEMWRPYLLGHFDGDGFTTLSRCGARTSTRDGAFSGHGRSSSRYATTCVSKSG
ncbi:MAG TPA: hypothetical protein VGH82_12630 [Gaiellaceae bacterium]|jgi:hypothetical protein